MCYFSLVWQNNCSNHSSTTTDDIVSAIKETLSVWHGFYESRGRVPLHCPMLSCSNPICTLLQMWFCTCLSICLSINVYVTISGFARADFTSFLPGQTVKTLALRRQVRIFFKYHCSASQCRHFRKMAHLSFNHILVEEDVTILVFK